jgi:uncharacterized protein YjbI with pentapeptide repeats
MRLDEWGGEFIVGSLLVGYDIGQNVKDEERHVAAETDPPTAPEPAEESEEQSSSVPLWLRVLAVLTVGGVFEVIIYGYLDRPGWIGVSDKKFWDYLELLIVPAALALGVYWLNRAQQERERKADEAQQRRERKAEEDRRERELEVENQRVQDAALQAYLDQMSRLLADKDRPLHKERPGDSLSTIARAHTLTVLPRLNGVRKRSVIQFLYESELIGGSAEGKEPVMLLHGADLRGADLRGITLKGANLPRTNLQRSNLSRAWLDGANLQRAVLSESNLTAAELDSVDLGGAWLEGAKLRRATLRNANLRQAQLIDADLGPTNLTELYDVGRSARLYSEADMKRTVKEGGKSRDTHYGGGADLRGADLRGANLRGANLRGANLSNVTGFTTGELKQEAKTLERATMPDGQKYYGAAVFEPAFHFLVSQDWVYYEAATTPNTLYIEGR